MKESTETMDMLEQMSWYQTILCLGKVAILNKYVNVNDIKEQISSFESHFKPYNPRKSGYNRYGLSITSRDGGFSGIPDLDSLLEYNRENKTNLSESDFREWSLFFKSCPMLQEIMSPFHKYMGRSHILRLNKGGFFPMHRDLTPECYRLFISFSHFDQFVFLLDDKRIFFEPGRLYFINTWLIHCLFSFVDKSDFAVFNIDLCEESVNALMDNLAIY